MKPAIPTGVMPMHLQLAMSSWMSSRAASQLWKSVYQNLSPISQVQQSQKPAASPQQNAKPSPSEPSSQAKAKPLPSDLRGQLEALKSLLQNEPPNPQQNPKQKAKNAKQEEDALRALFDNGDFWQAVASESEQRAHAMLDGVNNFRQHEYEYEGHANEVVWQKGNARLLDYGCNLNADAPRLMMIPSLINTAKIFDILKGYSMIEYLLAHGIRPLVLDWGVPGYRERYFDCADYSYKYALDAVKQLRRRSDAPLFMLGYCMGGLFASAVACLRPDLIDGLILLATPWDFQSKDSLHIPLEKEQKAQLREQLHAQDVLPKEWLEWMFHLMQPYRFQEKFGQYLTLGEEEREHFIAIEHWVSNGIPLANKVAEECLLLWPQENLLHKEQWEVAGQIIAPQHIHCPTLAIVPSDDNIVPSECAIALAGSIDECHILTPPCGHVSMVAGKRAERLCWKPLIGWIHALNG